MGTCGDTSTGQTRESSVDERIEIHVGVFEEETADEVATALRDHGATDVDTRTQHGVLPIVPIVIAASIGVTALAQIIKTWVDMGPRQIIDARATPLEIRIDKNFRDGKIIVITSDDAKVEIYDVPPLFDATEVTKAALESGTDAVKAAAEAAGAKAEISKPDGSETEPSM